MLPLLSISIFHPGNCVYVFFQKYFISLACFWSIKYINFIHKTPVFSFTPSFCFSQNDTVLSPCNTTSTNVWVQVSKHEIWWLSFLFRSLHSESWEYSAFSSFQLLSHFIEAELNPWKLINIFMLFIAWSFLCFYNTSECVNVLFWVLVI